MDIKNIGITIGVLAGSFLVILILVYLLFPVINPEEAEKHELVMAEEQTENQMISETESEISDEGQMTEIPFDTTEVVSKDSTSQRVTDNTSENEISKMEQLYIAQIDSLKQVVEKLKKEHELELQEVTTVQLEEKVQETTKTLLSMDENALAPILNELEEPILIKLYNTATGMQKRKLLQSLQPEKASRILKLVM
ncbi:MAG TPA: hypothetical protein VKM36_11840 [Balneolaceae bacterium]|nr:hypothetical protein [Balneolaceae bacterium]